MPKVKVKVPVSTISADRLKKSLTEIGKRLATRVNQTYYELTSDWRTDYARGEIDAPVVFTKKITWTHKGMTVEVKTDSLKYRFVDLGTEPHPIDPKPYPENPHGYLVFPEFFEPRTYVQSLEKNPSGGKDWDGPTIWTRHVDHPGSEGRDFEHPIYVEQTPIIIDELRRVLGDNMKVETEEYDV